MIGSQGYVGTLMPGHPRANKRGYVYEHITVVENYLSEAMGVKVYLDKGFDIHHKNKIKTDNRIENLEVMLPRDHSIHHMIEKRIGERITVETTYSRIKP